MDRNPFLTPFGPVKEQVWHPDRGSAAMESWELLSHLFLTLAPPPPSFPSLYPQGPLVRPRSMSADNMSMSAQIKPSKSQSREKLPCLSPLNMDRPFAGVLDLLKKAASGGMVICWITADQWLADPWLQNVWRLHSSYHRPNSLQSEPVFTPGV